MPVVVAVVVCVCWRGVQRGGRDVISQTKCQHTLHLLSPPISPLTSTARLRQLTPALSKSSWVVLRLQPELRCLMGTPERQPSLGIQRGFTLLTFSLHSRFPNKRCIANNGDLGGASQNSVTVQIYRTSSVKSSRWDPFQLLHSLRAEKSLTDSPTTISRRRESTGCETQRPDPANASENQNKSEGQRPERDK